MGPGALRGRRAVTFLLSRRPRLPHSPSWAEGHGCGSGNHGLPIPGSWEGHSRCRAASQSTGPRGRHGEALGRQPTPPRPHERGPAPHLQARPLSAQARTPGEALGGRTQGTVHDAPPRRGGRARAYTRVRVCLEKPFSPYVRITRVQNPGALFRSYFWKNVDSHNSNKRKILPQPT